MPQPCVPPASFSIRESDTNFCPMWKAIGPFFRVYLNGEHQSKVLAYDCAEGWVRRYRTGVDGRLAISPSGDGAEEETRHGTVSVTWGSDRA